MSEEAVLTRIPTFIDSGTMIGMSDPLPEHTAEMPDAFNSWQFRLVHIVYLVTILATSMATFGAGGVLLGILVGVFWASVFTSHSRPKAFLKSLLVALLCFCLIGVLMPAVQTAREAGSHITCLNNLKQIVIALHSYHDQYGSFPPAYITDENGQPKHSWRVLLLPFLEEQALYDKYDFDEPWNGPNNSKLVDSMPSIYSCPSATHDLQGQTSYVAIVGPHTAWPGASARTVSEITDGTTNTVLVLECNDQNTQWLEPQDLELSVALEVLASEDMAAAGNHKSEGFFYRYYHGRNMAMADGSVRFAGNRVGQEVWSALFIVNDGTVWDDRDLSARFTGGRQVNVGNCIRLGLFIVLALFPLPWVWLNPTSDVGSQRS